MKQHTIHDYFSLVYILGWIVLGIGAALIGKAMFSKGSIDLGIGILFGGLYMTAFVKNAWLKVKIIQLEQELQGR